MFFSVWGKFTKNKTKRLKCQRPQLYDSGDTESTKNIEGHLVCLADVTQPTLEAGFAGKLLLKDEAFPTVSISIVMVS